MTLPHVMKRIRLHLARSKSHPAGSAQHGYEIVAPLDPEGRIDQAEWQKHRDRCGVRRFWAGEADEIGKLVHKSGGSSHARWVFDYDESDTDDDEAGYRLESHVFRPGEYVSVRGHDGETHTFQVVSIVNA